MGNYDYQVNVEIDNSVINKDNKKNPTISCKYPIVYPAAGSTVVRPLFNPASGQIIRLINRDKKVACYRSYNTDCSKCKSHNNATNKQGWVSFGRNKANRAIGLCFAQFVSSTVPIEKGADKATIQPGDIILFMFPRSVYKQLKDIIQPIGRLPTGFDQAFCHYNTGLYIRVQVSDDSKCTTTQVPYMTFDCGKDDDSFLEMLDSMDSLTEQIIPSTITDEIDKKEKR